MNLKEKLSLCVDVESRNVEASSVQYKAGWMDKHTKNASKNDISESGLCTALVMLSASWPQQTPQLSSLY